MNVNMILNTAVAAAAASNHEFVTVSHLAMALASNKEGIELIGALQADVKKMREIATAHLATVPHRAEKPSGPVSIDFTPTARRVLVRANDIMASMGMPEVTVPMLLLSIIQEPGNADVFARAELAELPIKRMLADIKRRQKTGEPAAPDEPRKDERSALERFAVNLNEQAAAGRIDQLIGREPEILRTAQILARRRKNNPLLVGEPGVGKTAIAEGLARMIEDGTAPESLHGKKIWSLNVANLLAGTKYRGDFEERIKDVIKQAEDPDVVLFVDEIHTLIGAGSGGNGWMDASNIIKPALASGALRMIGATTFQEYRDIFEKEKALDRRFQKVDIVEPTPEQTVDILKGLKKPLEKHHGVRYTADAIKAAVDLSVKFIPDRFLPDKAIDILDEAGAAQRLQPPGKRHAFIDRDMIAEVIARVTRIPGPMVAADDAERIRDLPGGLKSVVFGQDEAIEQLTTAVCVAKAGLNDEAKPLGSFLFAGPTGVGKTEVTRQLGLQLGVPLLRFDMSEYQEQHSVARLIGSPPGYVGHDKGGLLTDAVFKNPHCVLLLDEIEKAHPDVYNLLLQVMDHGSLTDANGRKVNFKNVFLVMTTNAGASVAQKSSMGFLQNDRASDGRQVLDATFAPEFRNRLDAVVSFKALSPVEIASIVDKNIRALQDSLTAKSITLTVGPAARQAMAEEGFVPSMGARPMARVVANRLKKPLSEKMLFGDLRGGGKAEVDVIDGQWQWQVTPKPIKEASRKTRVRTSEPGIDPPPVKPTNHMKV